MICPNCGYEIKDDNLICENCGCELQIVPDLDFDIESEMNKTLSSIASKEFTVEDFDDLDDLDDDPNLFSFIVDKKIGRKTLYFIAGIVLAVITVSAIFLGSKISRNTSYDYQMKMAEEKLNENNILEAVTYLEKANKISPSADLLFEIADYYYTLGREYDAIYALTDIIDNEFNSSEKESAYRKVFTLYLQNQNYQAVAELLSNCNIQNILKDYSDYCIYVPEFNVQEGTYEQTMTLRISTEGDGDIYYTLDGTTPGVNSNPVDGPVYLEYGSYTVNAVYINKFGISSEVVTKNYLIDVEFVFEPDIITPSGDYEEATLIEAEVPIMYTLFYTTDGTTPNKESKRYTSPIPMLEGNHVYKFIMYATDGTESSVVERTYNLTLHLNYSPEEGVSALSNYLISQGRLKDGAHREGVDGTILLMYSAIYPIEGQGTYFFVIEYVEDALGNRRLTGNNYAVDANDLSVYSVESSDGEYILTRI